MLKNLALNPWLPVLCASGRRKWIAPFEITRDNLSDRILRIDSTRISWNGSLTEFLIGLYQTVLQPLDAGEWRDRWDNPPSLEYLKREFEKIAPCFELYSPSTPFLQDPSLASHPDCEWPIEKLLVDGVSENQEKKNTDIFMKSGDVAAMCVRCVAAALIDMQQHAPQGGPAFYVSNSGGAPIRTINAFDDLWKTVWANVIEASALSMKGRPDPEGFLPWMLKDRPSGLQKPVEGRGLDVYWSMSRRILLPPVTESGTCDTCAATNVGVIRTFRTARGGLQYSEPDWRHPLSPYVRKDEDGWFVRGSQSDIEGYRNWAGLLIDTPNGEGNPAFVVRRWLERKILNEPELRLWAFGYQSSQAAILRWVEGRMPVITVPNGHRTEYEHAIQTLIVLSQEAAEHLSSELYGVYKASHAANAGSVSHDALSTYWHKTEPTFLESARKLAETTDKAVLEGVKDEWMSTARNAALDIYNDRTAARWLRQEWVARYAHKLRRSLSNRNPRTIKTRKYGLWRMKNDE